MRRRPLTVGITSDANIDPEEVRRFVAPEPPQSRQPDSPPTTLSVDAAMPAAPRLQSTGVRPVGLIPVTVRLRPELAGALKRASLQRQLAGEPIFTQQDLVELVLEPWLRLQGYL